MPVAVIVILILIYFYSLLILLFYMEIDPDETVDDEPEEQTRPLSVIVPYRNEADYLPALMKDLADQTYPGEMYEIILVDDHSADDSYPLVESIAGKEARFHSLQLPTGQSGKKAALFHGIDRAKYDWIIQVDADCRVGPRFLASHMAFLKAHPSDLVAGVVSTGKEKGSFWEVFERLDLLSMSGVAAGSFSAGRPMLCSGANLAYSRELYLETRSFDPEASVASGDDMFLMIGARKLGRKLSYMTDRDSQVLTKAAGNLRSLLSQRIRWGSKTSRYQMADIQLLAVLVSLVNISVLLMPLWLVLFVQAWPWLILALLVKSLADFLILRRMTGMTGTREDLKKFIPVSLLYYPFFLVTVLGALPGRSRWKT